MVSGLLVSPFDESTNILCLGVGGDVVDPGRMEFKVGKDGV
jgi:hypothetical protein